MAYATLPLSLLPLQLPKYPLSLYTITPPNPSSTPKTRPFSRSRCLAVDRAGETLAAAPIAADDSSAAIRVVFTGGGSGGHVYPAIAIADEIKIARPESRILFVGNDGAIESSAASTAGYDFAAVPPARLRRPLLLRPSNLLLPFALLRSILASWQVLRDFRPHVVVGTGGYSAAPTCLAAAISNVPMVIQEQNAIPGLTNRRLAPFAKKVFLAFNACVQHFPKGKCDVRGNPVRMSLKRFVSKAVARSHFFPQAGSMIGDERGKVLLVLGGSMGSNEMNIAVLNMYYDMLSEHKNRFIIWQTGADGYDEMESLVKNHRRLLLTPFLHAMDLAYAAADIVVSRAGAMTCTEILTTGKPAILIPSPNAVDDHQTNNAYIMADIAGSIILEEDDLDSSSLEIAIDKLLADESVMAEISEKALRAAKPDAATEIAQSIISLVNLSSPK